MITTPFTDTAPEEIRVCILLRDKVEIEDAKNLSNRFFLTSIVTDISIMAESLSFF